MVLTVLLAFRLRTVAAWDPVGVAEDDAEDIAVPVNSPLYCVTDRLYSWPGGGGIIV